MSSCIGFNLLIDIFQLLKNILKLQTRDNNVLKISPTQIKLIHIFSQKQSKSIISFLKIYKMA